MKRANPRTYVKPVISTFAIRPIAWAMAMAGRLTVTVPRRHRIQVPRFVECW